MLPTIFIGLASLALLGGVLAFWQSLRAAFGTANTKALRMTLGSVERSTLVEEKNSLLRSIKDLQFERDVDKLSEEDWKKIDTSLRRRARQVLKALDVDVAPYRAAAETLVGAHLKKKVGSTGSPYRQKARDQGDQRDQGTVQCHECMTVNDEDADFCKKCGERLADLSCPDCQTVNDADSTFCKKCGHRFGEEPEEAAADSEDDDSDEADSETEGDDSGDDDSGDDDSGDDDSDEADSGEADSGEADSGDDDSDEADSETEDDDSGDAGANDDSSTEDDGEEQ